MVHAIFLAAYFGLVVGEGKCVGGSIDFGDNLDEALFGQLLQVDEFGFRVVSVFGGKARISVGLKTEGAVGLAPVLLEVLFEAVVVQVNLQVFIL